MADLITGLRAETVRANLERVTAEIARVRGAPGAVEVLAAVKYLPVAELGALAAGGIRVAGENRAQELVAKAQATAGAFTWDFIGQLQSRKVRELLPHVRYLHSVASDSVLTQLARHGSPATEVMIEVNVAGESGKGGILPAELASFLERCPATVVGLMTMPPQTADPERNRPHFAALRELASTHGLAQLSMGTSQDYLVAVAEGATIVRLGTILYQRPTPAP